MKAKHYANRVAFLIALSIFSLLIVQCAVPPGPVFQKDGQIYGKIEGQWGSRWWNYYQRGVSYAKGGYWDYAAKDFLHAIEQRSADQRRARTYGLHILDDYFPHRELGIVFYNQKRYEEAIAELQRSLSQFESAKAKYFLNLARQAFLEKTGLDHYPPKLFISYPKPGTSTRFSTLTLSAEAIDDQYVGLISVNKKKIPEELSNPNILFHSEIKLKRGKNVILVEVQDLVGRKSEEEIVVLCDQEAPLIGIDRLSEQPLEEGWHIIEGYVSDTSDVQGFWLNGRRVDLQEDTKGGFHIWQSVVDLMQPVMYEAEDKLGNRTSGEFYLQDFSNMLEDDAAGLTRLAFSGPDLKGMLAMKDANLASSRMPGNSGPVFRLKDIKDAMTVDWEEVFLEGEARDPDGVKTLLINGFPLIARPAKVVFFNFLIPLEVGDNLITIRAENLSGAAETMQLHINRRLNPVHEIGSRLHLAILPFKYSGERPELKDLIYESLIQNFVEQARFQVVDRKEIDRLLNSVDEAKEPPVELGRLVSAEGIVAGSAYFYDGYMELIAREIDTETTVVVDSEEVFGPVYSLKDVYLLAYGLSLKFKQAFPVVEGRVVDTGPEFIQIDLGKKDHILPYMKVIYFREGEPIKLPGSEKVLEKRPVILGEGRITKLSEAFSDTVILSSKAGDRIGRQDLVITK